MTLVGSKVKKSSFSEGIVLRHRSFEPLDSGALSFIAVLLWLSHDKNQVFTEPRKQFLVMHCVRRLCVHLFLCDFCGENW